MILAALLHSRLASLPHCRLARASPAQHKTFVRQFVGTIINQIYCTFREDHAQLFLFYLAMMYARNTQQFSELEWNLFLNMTIDSNEGEFVFSEQTFVDKWGALRARFIDFFTLPNARLAPPVMQKGYQFSTAPLPKSFHASQHQKGSELSQSQNQ